MDTLSAAARGEANRGREPMVFDWDRAARRIRETGATEASAGLASDWEWTGGYILRDGQPIHDDYTYLASTWATPELDLDGVTEDCYRMASETPGWGPDTKWPDSALTILNSEVDL